MICVKSKNQNMGFVILFMLLLLLLLLSTTPCSAAGRARFERPRGGSSSASELKPSRFHGGIQGNSADEHGDQVFGADKRKVYTGPNPLHNR